MTQDYSAESQPTPASALGNLIEQNPRLVIVLGIIAIVLFALIAYSPAIEGDFVWDDDYYVSNNQLLRSWEGLQRIWTDVFPDPALYPLPQYYPMTHTSFWLEYRLWGLNPTGYHAVNVALHILDALLIWLILSKLRVPGAWLAAMIFAVHPINVESVAWIAERKNVLSLMFFLCSLYVYLRYAGIIPGSAHKLAAPKEGETSQPAHWAGLPDDPARLYALAAVLFLCALFSKTITNSLPAVVLLIIWWKRGRITVKDLLPLLLFFAAGIGMGLLTAYMERWRVGVALRPGPWDYAPTLLGEVGARCIIAGKVFWFYLGKLILPHPLSFNYAPRWTIDPANPVQYLFPLSALGLLVALLLGRKRFGNGPLIAAFFYAGTLVPAMGFFDVWPMQYSFVADHFVYFSGIGLFVLLAAAARKFLTAEMLAGVAVLLLCTMLALTFSRSRVFQSPLALWTDTLNKTDARSWFALNNYGAWLLTDGAKADPIDRLAWAERAFKRVIQIKPDHPESRRNLAKIAEARARIMAMVEERQAAATQPATLAATTRSSDYYQQAIEYYRQALEVDPKFVDAHFDLAGRLRANGDIDGALLHYRTVVELDPRHGPALSVIGEMIQQQGKLDEAIKLFEQVVELQPKSVADRVKLGTALLEAGRAVEGFGQWEQALRDAPDNPEWPIHLGVKLAASGEYTQAALYFKRALDIDPRSVEALTNQGIVAVKLNRAVEGKKLLEEALKINPRFAKAQEALAAMESGRLLPATTQSTTRQTAQ